MHFSDYSGDLSMSWDNTAVFPIKPGGFSWPNASSTTFLPLSTQSSSLIHPLVPQPTPLSTATGSRSFFVVSFPTTKELLTTAAPYSSHVSVVMLESSGVTYPTSVVGGTPSVPHAVLTSSQCTNNVNYNPTDTSLPTGKNTLAY